MKVYISEEEEASDDDGQDRDPSRDKADSDEDDAYSDEGRLGNVFTEEGVAGLEHVSHKTIPLMAESSP